MGGSSQDGVKDETSLCEDQSSRPTCEELICQVNNHLTDEDVKQWLGEDVNNPRYHLLSEELVQQVRKEVAPAENDKSDEDPDEPNIPSNGEVAPAEDDKSDEDPDEPNIPSNGEAAEILDKCMR